MKNLDLSAVFAGLAVLLSFLGLIFQRIDIRKQNKYQRDTFELQNQIDINNRLIDVSAKIIQLINQKLKLTVRIMEKKVLIKKYEENSLSKTSEFMEEIIKEYDELDILETNLSTLRTEYIGTKVTLGILLKAFGEHESIKKSLSNIESSIYNMYKFNGNQEADEQKKKISEIIKRERKKINNNIFNYRAEIEEIQNGIFAEINKIKNNSI
ncbi:hypothetical protein ACI1UM_03960 [Lactococcus petauri]|uniref:hypothetical protein n=1 Tax=Lactococcus petauri TaxID=1940789 RepID=UPI0038528420